ncbi:MAG TPA: hypothetical protein VG603_01645 [Chitinophagales bacterium]|nr:hypothetical protein [Chitinophagales bacterium]
MKKSIKSLLAFGAISAILVVSSCTKTCDTGYEGSDCKTEVRAKFLSNNISASETKNGGTAYSYSTSIISSSSDLLTVYLTKVANGFFNSNVKATVNGTALTIESQEPDADGYTIQGNGSITDKTITLTYTITGLNAAVPPVTVTDTYQATWTIQ